jgi:DedD protein
MGTSAQDTEITLGTGRMLALFFTFVVVCAGFFAIGFSLGRKTSVLSVNNGFSAASNSVAAHSAAGKDTTTKSASQSTDFSFYKSVGSEGANTELSPKNSKAQPTATPPPEAQAATAPSSSSTAANAGYFVQVAAVSRQEDAEALVEALKKKQYPAFAANNSSTDKYYHVQVGPYADFKEADAMRARLVADGYNPIVKK